MTTIISECKKYRYYLERDDMSNPLVFIMLNPSTADADNDDPTIRRCRRFAKDNGYTGLVVVNLYGYRATNPKELKSVADPIGAMNDKNVLAACVNRDVCCAWGNNANKDRALNILNLVEGKAKNIFALDVAKTGMPKHPLYLPASSKLTPYVLEQQK